MTPDQAIHALQRRGAEITRAIEETAREVFDQAVEWSSGPHSLRALARMDHPYAKRHGSATLPPHIINAQSGDFRRAWRIERLSASRLRVINDDPKVRFLKGGTRLMVDRPIENELRAFARDALRRRLPGTRIT